MAAVPDFKIRALKLTEEAELPLLVPDEAKATLHPHYMVRAAARFEATSAPATLRRLSPSCSEN